MVSDRPWVRHELPWLRSGPLFRVHVDAFDVLSAFLGRFSYAVVELDGRRMSSRREAHQELARAFDFPGYYGSNWDAWNDCFGDYVADHDGALTAVVWHHVEAAVEAAPATAIEVGWALLEAKVGHMPTLGPGGDWTISLDVFALGTSPDFDRP